MPPSRPSNVKLLTEGAQYIKRKKRQDTVKGNGRDKQIDKILFNDDDRAEFLTGFSKRKQAKLAEKRERAKKRDEDELKAQKKEVRFHFSWGTPLPNLRTPPLVCAFENAETDSTLTSTVVAGLSFLVDAGGEEEQGSRACCQD